MTCMRAEPTVIRDISPKDEMYAFDKGREGCYWRVGESGLEVVRQGLRAARKSPSEVRRILDLPCGHGRVLRYLKAGFPETEITACDLNRDGVDFCASTFGAVPCYSHIDPTRIPLSRGSFDLIWVGSLFTHLAAPRWGAFLKSFAETLAEDGLLVFTAHGRHIHNRMTGIGETVNYGLSYWQNTLVVRSYERTGFGYSDYSGQRDYGISLSHPAWVCNEIRKLRELTLVQFMDRAWAEAHDIYVCRRRVKAEIENAPVGTWIYAKHRVRQLTPSFLIRMAKTLLGRG